MDCMELQPRGARGGGSSASSSPRRPQAALCSSTHALLFFPLVDKNVIFVC